MTSAGSVSSRVGSATEPDTARRWSAAHEVALLAVVTLVQVGGTVLASRHQDDRSFTVGAVVLLLLPIALLPLRHRWPAVTLFAVLAATATYWSLGFPRGPVFLPLLVAFVHAVVSGRRRAAIASLLVGFLAFTWLAYLLGNEEAPSLLGVLGLAAWLVALLSVVEVVRSRRDRAAEGARVREEATRRRATDERMRIARDLHDAVAHDLSLISIRAGAALHVATDLAPETRDALEVIKAASKDALVELRSILGVLRQVDEHEPRAPTPSLARLDDLVAQAGLTGVDVHLDVAADIGDLPVSTDLAAYRIVQESLTNVARHSDRPEATVRIRAEEDDGHDVLVVEVLDDGSGRSRRELPTGGNGIPGMRERAAAVGGSLEAGPRPGRGFRVRAELPIGERQ